MYVHIYAYIYMHTYVFLHYLNINVSTLVTESYDF